MRLWPSIFVVLIAVAMAAPAVAQYTGYIEQYYEKTLLPPNYPNPAYIWPDGSKHNAPPPANLPPLQPSQPSNHPSKPQQGGTSYNVPPTILATIRQDDPEAGDPKGFKVGSVATRGGGTVYVTIGNSHLSGWAVQNQPLVPHSTIWFTVDGTLVRNANGPGKDVFKITGLHLQSGARDPTPYTVPLYPNKVVQAPTRKAINPPPEGPQPGRGYCGVVVRC